MALRDRQLAWLDEAKAVGGYASDRQLAAAARINPSTLSKFRTGSGLLSDLVVNRIAAATGIEPVSNGIGAEVTSWRAALPAPQLAAHQHAYVMRSRAMELADISPGDILVFDTSAAPWAGAVVLVRRFDPRGVSELLVREWREPFLIARSRQSLTPLLPDRRSVVILAPLVRLITDRQFGPAERGNDMMTG